MKEQFISKRFNKKTRGLLDILVGHIEDYARDGFDLTVRQLYYRLVAANKISNTFEEYKKIVRLISEARLSGILDWAAIVDRGRSALRQSNWEGPWDILDSARAGYKLDKWKDQPHYLEVMVEKQALQGVLVPICEELDITLTANKGYSSQSTQYRAGKRFRSRSIQGKRLHILYLGDHDPSGMDMTNDIENRVPMLGGETIENGSAPLDIDVHRLALNIGQIRKWKDSCPPNPCKESDSRAAGYVAQFGKDSWELDAVEPRELAKLVRTAVLKYRDEELWAKAVEREEKDRAALKKVADKFRKANKNSK